MYTKLFVKFNEGFAIFFPFDNATCTSLIVVVFIEFKS